MSDVPTQTDQAIRIRWRRYGKSGGRWRADFPPDPETGERGSVESNLLDIVRMAAGLKALAHGWTIVEEPKP